MLNVLVNVCSVGMPSDHVSAPTIDSRPAFTRCLHQPASNRMSIHICQSVTPHHTTTVLRPFFREHPGEPVLEENFWSLWCKVRLTKADTPTHPAGCHSIWTNQCPAPPSPPQLFYMPDALPAAQPTVSKQQHYHHNDHYHYYGFHMESVYVTPLRRTLVSSP